MGSGGHCIPAQRREQSRCCAVALLRHRCTTRRGRFFHERASCRRDGARHGRQCIPCRCHETHAIVGQWIGTTLFWWGYSHPNNSQEITYSFIGGTNRQQSKVNTVVQEWFVTLYANVTFKPLATGGMLRIAFDPSGGSWSYVGTQNELISSDQATMNFGWVYDTTNTSDDEKGVILHEFGHALGLMHELQSPARGGTITLDEKAVYDYYGETQHWDRATIKSQIIDVYNAGDVSNYSALDVTSVMMYFMPAQMNLERIDISVNDQLSYLDKAYMVINYPRSEPNPSASTWTLDYALRIAGVDASTAKKITDANAKADATMVRSLFTDFQISVRIANARAADVTPAAGAVDPDLIPADTWCAAQSELDTTTGVSNDVQRGVAVTRQLWFPKERITYGFLKGEGESQPTEYRKERARAVLKFYEQYASIKFVEVDGIDTLEFDNPAAREQCWIRISFERYAYRDRTRSDLGWSFYGPNGIHRPNPNPFGPPYMTAWISGQAYESDAELNPEFLKISNRTLYHEFGHVLGMQHEHVSPNTETTDDPLHQSRVGSIVATIFDNESVMLYADKPYTRPRGSSTTPLNFKPSATDLAILSVRELALDAFKFDSKVKERLLKTVSGMLDDADRLGGGANRGVWAAALRGDVAAGLKDNNRLERRLVTWGSAWPLPESWPLDQDFGPRTRNALQGVNAGGANLQNAPAPTPPAGGTSGQAPVPGFLFQLVDKLKQFFNPGGNQMFTLQFPGRYLDQASYAWDTSSAGIYGQFIKPTVVNEAEFRLVDQLYDMADVVAGPNGMNLSIVYQQLLNNLLPKYVNNGLAEQQDLIRQWMLKEVPTTQWIADIMERQRARELTLAQSIASSMAALPPPARASVPDLKATAKGDALNRIELSELLMNEYLYAKQDWELERDALINQATQRALNALTRQLSHITDTRQAQLASKYADAVVRGYSHTVRQYMGYMDISSPAEALQDAKDSLREAAMSSLDGSMNVYPVQLTPLDWFESLSTSFTMEDLTQNTDVIRTQISFKSQQLDTLNSQLVALQMGSRGNSAELQAKVQEAQTSLDAAQSTLAQQYTMNVIQLAQTYFDTKGDVNLEALEAELGIADNDEFAKAALAQLPAQLKAVQDAQDNLTAWSRALSQLLAAQALAEATDSKQQQQQLTLQIQSVTADLRELQTRWKVLTASTGGINLPNPMAAADKLSNTRLDITTTLELPPDTSGGSRWQTIALTSSATTRSQTMADHSGASSQQWACNIWFASASGSSSSASAEASSNSSSLTDTIDLAFRATLVTVDRGGWFQPQFFKESKAFYKVNPNISWSDVEGGVKGLMPAFPIGFLVVKDIVVRIVHSDFTASDSKASV
ncbi:hypothetical protein GGX14DRAFT_373421 [Mycena pura]|uniref:Peptidase metallopeptidase domain-containing protein n=1 Tax=Mycena pura TaxID=153505 RepID=A0AAD6Y385_9AGAR|nr:hypothetical protein GGX14DRAFT_373421 [Mycena pura]